MARLAAVIIATIVSMTSSVHAELAEGPTTPDRVAVVERALSDFDEGLALLDSDPDQAARLLHTAADGFETIIRSGVENGRLYYNLGNTYLQLGRLGPATANYRRAERLIPGDEQLKTNLEYARNLRRNRIGAAGSKTLLRTLFFWHHGVPLRTRYLCGLGLYVVFWLVLIIRPVMHPARWSATGGLAVLLAVCWISLGLSVVVEWQVQSQTVAGVIVADDTVVRKGNSTGYEPQFKQLLHEGVEFTLIESRGNWLRIELPDGNTGWIRADQAELV